jgi:hypothetical protein
MNETIINTKMLENAVQNLNGRSKKRYGLMASDYGYMLVEFLNGKDTRDGVHSIAFGRTKAELFYKICVILEFLENESSED